MFDAAQFVTQVQGWGRELGFSQIGVAGVDLRHAEAGLLQWLQAGFHGQMHYMAAHGLKRARPAELVPGTLSVITARMDYLPASGNPGWREQEWKTLQQPLQANVALYARGRDYHKVLRQPRPLRCANSTSSTGAESVNTCLLYTSPSPRDGATSRMPSSA